MLVEYSKIQKLTEWLALKIKLDKNAASAAGRRVYRGQVYYCDLGENIGSEETKKRPVLIIQNDTGNRHSPNVIVAPITNSPGTPTVTVPVTAVTRLDGEMLTGYVLLSNIVTVSKARLGDLLLRNFAQMDDVEEKLITSVGLYKKFNSLKKQLEGQTKRGDRLKNKIEDIALMLGVPANAEDIKSEIARLQERVKEIDSDIEEK